MEDMARTDYPFAGNENVRPNGIAVPRQQYFAYITLITNARYLAGVVMLAHTLKKQGSKYPLIVLYTSSMTTTAMRALKLEEERSGLILEECELLIPPKADDLPAVYDRFVDTWTKLRVFETFNLGFDTLCYLDADMMMFKNMDTIFDKAKDLPLGWIAAAHDCICAPNRTKETPDFYCPANCPFTPQVHPQSSEESLMVTPNTFHAYHLFNSGMFLFHPREELWLELHGFFVTTDLLPTFKYPDQQLMQHFFRNKFMSVSYKYNAQKTIRYRHKACWNDDAVVCLHYVVDKPWSQRIGPGTGAGLYNADGETHSWWWKEYQKWVEARRAQGEFEVVDMVGKHVIASDDESSDEDRPDLTMLGTRANFITNATQGAGFKNRIKRAFSFSIKRKASVANGSKDKGKAKR